jgi:rhodanese-related sulfurtransferase
MKQYRSDHPWIQSIRQLSVIVLAAVVVALISNHFRSDRLPLAGNWSQDARLTTPSGRQMAISLDEAKMLHQPNGAVFMDARPMEEYVNGHIQGAISLPWHEAEQKVMDIVMDMSNDTVIITYCDGDTCSLSKELALFLDNLGFSKTRILINGWSVWKDAGLPVEAGK